MIGIVPLVVMGGVVKKFSDGFFGEPEKAKKKSRTANSVTVKQARKTGIQKQGYPSAKYRPF